MKKSILKEYAKLIVKTGVNVQENQDVVIRASVDDAYFVKYVIEEAYKAKARSVEVEWGFQPLTKLAYQYENIETLTNIPKWKLKKQEHRVKTLPAMIHIVSEDPDGLAGIDQEKLLNVQRKVGPIMMKYRMEMDNKFQWTIVGIPGEKWAKKVFPKLRKKEAVKALWEAILKVTRVDGNALKNWEEHNQNLSLKTTKLKDLSILFLRQRL